ncbi:MAG TPA: DUF1572 family protein [Chitinophagaceae bacterium]|nr:DUF1572 family protein [Chitinophagaceae bacterium]
MLIDTLKMILSRDLMKLKAEIELYKNEKNIWLIDKDIANSAGNLCLHLIGNLNTYIGKEIGKTNYVRDRDLEFSQKDVARTELVRNINATAIVVQDALGKMKEEELDKEYPLLVFDKKTSTEYFLVHLVAHFSYHLGQINYHRRLLDN